MSALQRRKGADGERELARLLRESLGAAQGAESLARTEIEK